MRRLKRIIPDRVRYYFRKKLDRMIAKIKAPKMIYGYQNCGGAWMPKTRISDTVLIYHPEKIQIDNNVFVWHYTILDGTGGLEIGEGSQIGAWVGLFTHSSHIAIRLYGKHYQDVHEEDKKGYPTKSVKIGKYVFVGASAKILPGVTINDGALISAGAVVSKDVGDFEIVAGNPAKVIGDTRRLDKRYLKDPEIFEWYNEWQKK